MTPVLAATASEQAELLVFIAAPRRGHRPRHGPDPQRRLLGPAAGGQLLLPGRVLRAAGGPVRGRRAGDRVRRRSAGLGSSAGRACLHGNEEAVSKIKGSARRPSCSPWGCWSRSPGPCSLGWPTPRRPAWPRPTRAATSRRLLGRAVHPLHLRLRDRRGPAGGGRRRRPGAGEAAAMRVGPGAYLLLSAVLFGIGVVGVLIRATPSSCSCASS